MSDTWFIRVLSGPHRPDRLFVSVSVLRDPAVGLKSLYEFVRSSVSSSGSRAEGAEEWGPPVLLVDDLSVLLSLGVSVGAVLDFSHYCRATVCSELQVRLSTLLLLFYFLRSVLTLTVTSGQRGDAGTL